MRVLALTIVMLLSAVGPIFYSQNASAAQYDWMNENLSAEKIDDTSSLEGQRRNVTDLCSWREVEYYNHHIHKFITKSLCVHTAKSFTIAKATGCTSS